MSNVIITADSTCDITAEILQKYGNIEILPLYTVLGDKSLRDGVEVVPDDIYSYVEKNGVLPKTSAGSVDDYISLFKKYADDGKEVVHINISSEMSSSYQNACIAASEVGNAQVVDSRNLSTGSGLLVMDAADMALEGKSAQQIAEKVRERASLVRASFVIDQLEYLRMGGRCSSVAMLGANLLKIKPEIVVGQDGKMSMGDKSRGSYDKVLIKYVEKILAVQGINKKRVFVTHTRCDDAIVQSVVDTVKNLVDFEEVYVTTAGCVITSHCGPNTLGVLFEMQEN